MKMKNVISIILGVVIIGGGSFYGGMKYDQSKNSLASVGAARFGNSGGTNNGTMRGNRSGNNGFASGEIISKDDKSITIQLGGNTQQSGGQNSQAGSKIIFFSDSTPITKSVNGAVNDLKIGEQVTANGAANQDGSITAQSIQIRPETLQKQN